MTSYAEHNSPYHLDSHLVGRVARMALQPPLGLCTQRCNARLIGDSHCHDRQWANLKNGTTAVPYAPRDKSAYKKWKVRHIEESYEKRGATEDEAKRRAWDTVQGQSSGRNIKVQECRSPYQ